MTTIHLCSTVHSVSQAGGLKWTMVEVCLLRKQANTTHQDFPPERQLLTLPAHHCPGAGCGPSGRMLHPGGPRCSARGSWLSSPFLILQGFVLLPKTECDVREVEFARCLRLRQTSLEPVAFRLPRVRVRLSPRTPAPAPLPDTGKDFNSCLVLPSDIPTLLLFGYTCFLILLKFWNSWKPQYKVGGVRSAGLNAGVPWASSQCLRTAPSSPAERVLPG
jgi:hypothetical protein